MYGAVIKLALQVNKWLPTSNELTNVPYYVRDLSVNLVFLANAKLISQGWQ